MGASKGAAIGHISIHALLAESDSLHSISCMTHMHFYPRSPCGERLFGLCEGVFLLRISIHALLAESDHYDNYNLHCVEISIHALLAESDYLGAWKSRNVCGISIHALLAESDYQDKFSLPPAKNFYPRSPCGERRWLSLITLPEMLFLSTLSLRRATVSFA